jgi:hypothetical protein
MDFTLIYQCTNFHKPRTDPSVINYVRVILLFILLALLLVSKVGKVNFVLTGFGVLQKCLELPEMKRTFII